MMSQIRNIILVYSSCLACATASEGQYDADYWTIEGMRSQEFSVGIFIFMMIGVLVFLGIIVHVVISKKTTERLKTGEKVLLLWIILGVIAAVSFGAMQLLHGRLF
jgi:thiol:disulfide interchange protein